MMAFESLGDKLKGVFNKLTGRGTLSEKDIKEAMRQVRLALLEADVNYKVTKEFVAKVSEKAASHQNRTAGADGADGRPARGAEGGKQTTDGDCAMRPAGRR